MKKVLIVDDEKLFLASLTEGLSSYANEFEVLVANDGKQAIEILDSQQIDAMVTDLNMPIMDGFQLLAYVIKYHPTLSILVMTAFGTPEIEKHLQEFEVVGYLEKPIDFQVLTDRIRTTLAQSARGNITGITLSSFLQLLEIEKKTCLVKVISENGEGLLYFFAGKLVDALYGKYEGEKAVHIILGWEYVEIEISEIVKKIQKRINKSLSNLLMEAAQLKDEGSSDEIMLDPDLDSEPEQLPISDLNNLKEETASKLADERSQLKSKEINMGNVNECLTDLMKVDGAMAASVVDAKSGMALGMIGGGLNLEIAAAGNSEVVRSKLKTMQSLGMKDKIEDILITLGQQYHLIRLVAAAPNLFIYYVLNRSQSNLAMARHKLSEIESRLEV